MEKFSSIDDIKSFTSEHERHELLQNGFDLVNRTCSNVRYQMFVKYASIFYKDK